MNNEPVAWIAKTYYPNGFFEDDLVWSKVDENSIPLYTHPVKELKLTHEELVECIDGHIPLGLIEDYGWERIYEFARAILRKAQEK